MASFATRLILFTGATRIAYERELKRFLDYAHDVLGRTDNAQIDKRDFRVYLESKIARGAARAELNKIRTSIVKFGALYGKWESFHAMSRKLGGRIRQLDLPGPRRPHVMPDIRQAALDRLHELDAQAETKSGCPRGYALALELQKQASLRSIEATDRFTARSMIGNGKIEILGKGGRRRHASISEQLHERLQFHFCRSPESAREYRENLQAGETTRDARKLAVEDTWNTLAIPGRARTWPTPIWERGARHHIDRARSQYDRRPFILALLWIIPADPARGPAVAST